MLGGASPAQHEIGIIVETRLASSPIAQGLGDVETRQASSLRLWVIQKNRRQHAHGAGMQAENETSLASGFWHFCVACGASRSKTGQNA